MGGRKPIFYGFERLESQDLERISRFAYEFDELILSVIQEGRGKPFLFGRPPEVIVDAPLNKIRVRKLYGYSRGKIIVPVNSSYESEANIVGSGTWYVVAVPRPPLLPDSSQYECRIFFDPQSCSESHRLCPVYEYIRTYCIEVKDNVLDDELVIGILNGTNFTPRYNLLFYQNGDLNPIDSQEPKLFNIREFSSCVLKTIAEIKEQEKTCPKWYSPIKLSLSRHQEVYDTDQIGQQSPTDKVEVDKAGGKFKYITDNVVRWEVLEQGVMNLYSSQGNVFCVNQYGSGMFCGSLVVKGDLMVCGSTSYICTQNLVVRDNIVEINSGAPQNWTGEAGIAINEGDGCLMIEERKDQNSRYIDVFRCAGGNRLPIDASIYGRWVAGYSDVLGWNRISCNFSWDGNNTHFYWNRIYRLNFGDTATISFYVHSRSDYNYPSYGMFLVNVSAYLTGSISVHIQPVAVSGSNPRIKIAIVHNQNTLEVWLWSNAIWISDVLFKTVQNIGSWREVPPSEWSPYDGNQPPGTIMVVEDGEWGRYSFSDGQVSKRRVQPFLTGDGRVGIGTTSPSAKLLIDGEGTDPVVSITNTGCYPSLQFCGGSGQRVWFTNSSNQHRGSILYDFNGDFLSFRASGIDHTMALKGGNVGIGTTNPTAKLEVVGGYKTTGLIGSTGLKIASGGNSPDAVQIYWGDNTGWKLHFGTSTNGNFTPRMTIVDWGRVGIGTTNPSATLDVVGDVSILGGSMKFDCSWLPNPSFQGRTYYTRASIQVYPGNTDNSISIHTTGGCSTALVVDGPIMSLEGGAYFAGNVGIGTTNPSQKLQIEDDVNGTVSMIVVNSNDLSVGLDAYASGNDRRAIISWEGVGNVPLTFRTNVQWNGDRGSTGIEVMRITSNGRVGIGTTNPLAKLFIDGEGTDPVVAIRNTGSYPSLQFCGGTGQRIWFTNDSGQNRGSILYDFNNDFLSFRASTIENTMVLKGGNVGIGTTNPSQKLHVEGNIYACGNIGASGNINANGNIYASGNIDASCICACRIYSSYGLCLSGSNACSLYGVGGFNIFSCLNQSCWAHIYSIALYHFAQLCVCGTTSASTCIVTNGVMCASNFICSSSASLKSNIVDMFINYELYEKLLDVPIKRFVWKDSNKEDWGLIAEEVRDMGLTDISDGNGIDMGKVSLYQLIILRQHRDCICKLEECICKMEERIKEIEDR